MDYIRGSKRKSAPEVGDIDDKGKKRHRRTAQEIERKFRCEVTSCGKAYGSEGALKMHVRLKHSDDAIITSCKPEVVFPISDCTPPPTCTTPHSSAPSSPVSLGTPEPVIPEPEVDYNEFKELKERYCHIPLLRLNIGLWQAESQCCGDLVAKFCYKERTILWEIFDVGSLLRTVISFDDLNGVGLELHPDDTATMVIELRCPPKFFKGVLQPHEATIWTKIGDFTEGMASTFRRHILHFSRRALNEQIEDIFRRDPRLQGLLLQGLPALKSPYFAPETVSPPVDWTAQQQPIKQQPTDEEEELSHCAQQNCKSYPSFLDKHASERILLPCGHAVISTSDLLRECPCVVCGTSYFFSFCAQRVVANDEMWHCAACNGCKTKKEWHCSWCNKCTRVPPAVGIPNNVRGVGQICQSCVPKQTQQPQNQGCSQNHNNNVAVANGRGRKRKVALPLAPPPIACGVASSTPFYY